MPAKGVARRFWRISGFADLSGEGAKVAPGRWHSKGSPIVYLAESPAGALLERLVHLQDGNGALPRTYNLLEVFAPEGLELTDLTARVENGWKEAIGSTQRMGDAWLASQATVLARVPSAIVARTWNVLLNPAHAEAHKVRIESVLRERFDSRLFGWQGL